MVLLHCAESTFLPGRTASHDFALAAWTLAGLKVVYRIRAPLKCLANNLAKNSKRPSILPGARIESIVLRRWLPTNRFFHAGNRIGGRHIYSNSWYIAKVLYLKLKAMMNSCTRQNVNKKYYFNNYENYNNIANLYLYAIKTDSIRINSI